MTSLETLNGRIREEAAFVADILKQTSRIIVGQDNLIRHMLVALLADGHALIEGVPGLAKTLAVRTLASTLNADFKRIQFTPDLLPSDIIGTQIYNPGDHTFVPRPGPIFSNIILADEINRAPAKVQSALLEAMEERQVTLGDTTFRMKEPFLVLATQNPIEQEGTYTLPEAQLDRFMLKILVHYPNRTQERTIIDRMSGHIIEQATAVIEPETILHARNVVDTVYVDDRLKEYILDLIFATRDASATGSKKLAAMIEYGVSPRATLFLVRSAKAHAFLEGRGYVTPDDIKFMAPAVLRHRLILSFEAQAEAITPEQIIEHLLRRVEVP